MAKRAALFVGGWEGHTPTVFCDWATALLEEEGFDVIAYDTFEPLLDVDITASLDLIVPIWSSARSSHQDEFGNITREQAQYRRKNGFSIAAITRLHCNCE